MRDWFAAASAFGLFCLALLLDSNSAGIMPLFWAALVVLVAAGVCLPRTLPNWLACNPMQGVYLSLLVVLLVLLYQLSQSADNSFGLTWMWCISVVAYLLLASASAEQRNRAWAGVLLVIAATAVISIWNFFVNDLRAAWPVGDPNNYASLLYLVWVPWLHHQLVGYTTNRRWAFGLVFSGIASVAMYTTESRAGAGLVLLAFVVWVLLAITQKVSLRPVIAHLATTVGIFTMCVLTLGAQGVAATGNSSIEGGIGVRLQLALAALNLVPEHPLTGFGLNAFSALYAARRPITDQVTAGRLVHNDYIQFLVEGGPLLLLALVVLVGFAARLLWVAARSDKDSQHFARLGFVLAACLLLAHACVNFVFYRFSLPVGLAVVLAMAQAPRGSRVLPSPLTRLAKFWHGLPKAWLWGPLLGGWIAFAYLVVDVVTAGILEGQDSVPFADKLRTDSASVHKWARLAQSLNADRGLPLLADASLSAALIPQGNTADRALRTAYAHGKFREALQVDPWNTNSYMAFYQFVQQHPELTPELPEWEQPVSLLLRAVALDRQYVPALDELLRITQAQPNERDKVLLNLIAPWLELIARVNLPAAQHYLEELRRLLPAAKVSYFETLFEGLGKRKGLHQRRR